jgi:hypothetical protein
MQKMLKENDYSNINHPLFIEQIPNLFVSFIRIQDFLNHAKKKVNENITIRLFLIYINHGQTKKKETRIKMFVHTMVFDIHIVFLFLSNINSSIKTMKFWKKNKMKQK